MSKDSRSILEATELQQHLNRELPFWCLKGNAIEREFQTTGWKSSLMLVNAVAFLSEAAWHHPQLQVSYASVGVTLTTHSAGGVTRQDIDLAKKIDELVCWPEGVEPPAKHALFKPETL